MYDWLIKKVNAIHSNKQKFEKKNQDVDKKIPDSEGLINYKQIFMQEWQKYQKTLHLKNS